VRDRDRRDDRQRVLLEGKAVRGNLQGPRSQTHPYQTLHAKDQRQGGAVHPDRTRRTGLQHLRISASPTSRHGPTCKIGVTRTAA
jgi:hypothetical protein